MICLPPTDQSGCSILPSCVLICISLPDRFNSAAVGGAIGGVVGVLVGVAIFAMCVVMLHRWKGNKYCIQQLSIKF